MAVIGSAYVVVRALTDKLQADINKAVNNSARDSRGSGDKLGENIAEGMKDKIESGGIEESLTLVMDRSAELVSARSRQIGLDMSDGIGAGAAQGGGIEGFIDRQFDGIIEASYGRGNEVGLSFGDGFGDGIGDGVGGGGGGGGGGAFDDLEAAAGDAGDRAGGNFGRNFGRGFSGVGDSLFKIITRVALLGTVIAGAVGGISALVSGLFAIASAAGTAASALVVLPSLLGALAQGAVAGLLAFGGIGAAVKASTAAQVSGGQQAEASARQQVMAARAVRDANERLKDTIEENAQRMVDAHDRVREARERLADAEKDAADAQDDIGEAREAAAERLQQLGFSVRQAAIDEREATKALADAQRGYAEALLQPIPFDPDMTEAERLQITLRQRNAAQEALEKASLTAERAADRHADLAKEQEEESKKGVEGSDEVVRAKEREADAIERVADAEDELADSRANVVQVERNNARAIRDARQAVADALYNQKTAQDATSASASALNKAMDRLSPEAQRFVKFLVALRPEIDKLRASAGRELFPKLEIAIQNLVDNFFPALRKSLRDTGSAIGDAAISISNGVIRMTKDGDFAKISDTNTTSIRRLGQVVGSLVGAFGSILAAAAPLVDKFTQFLVVQAEVFEAWADSKQKSGELTDGFNKAGVRAGQLGRIIKNIVVGFFRLGQVASESGGDLLKSFEEATERFAHMFDSNARADEVGDQFAVIAENVKAISTLAATTGGVLFRLGANPALAGIADDLNTMLPGLEDLLNTLIERFGPALTDLFDTILLIFNEMADAGGFEIALGIFQQVADVLLLIVSTDAGKYLIATLAAFKAIRAVGRFTGVTGLMTQLGKSGVFKGAIAGLRGTGDEMKGIAGVAQRAGGRVKGFFTGTGEAAAASGTKVGLMSRIFGKTGIIAGGLSKVMRGVGLAMRFMLGPVGLIIAAVALVVAGFVLLYKKNEAFKNFVDNVLMPALRNLGSFFTDNIVPALKSVGDFIEKNVLPALEKFGDWLNDYVLVPWIAFATFMIRRVYPVIGTIMKFILRLATVHFKILWGAVKLVVKVFTAFVSTSIRIAKRVIDAFNDVVDFFRDLPGNIARIAGDIWDWLADATEKITDTVEDFIDDVVGFVKGLPRKLFNAGKSAWEWWDDLVDDAVDAVADFVIDSVEYVKSLPRKLANAGKTAWDWWADLCDDITGFVTDAFSDVLNFIGGLAVKLSRTAGNIWGWITEKFGDMRSTLNERIGALVEYVKGIPGRFVQGVRNIWGFFTEQWTTMRTNINEKITAFVTKIRTLPGALANGVGNMWGFITAGLTSMLNGALRLVNSGIDKINSLIGKLNNLPGIEIRFIPRLGYIVETRKPDGPVIVRGPGGKPIPAAASGGTFKAMPGGTLAFVAEAGRDERIEPLDSSGLSAGDRSILTAIRELASAQVYAPVITVHGQDTPRKTAQEILITQRRAVLDSTIWTN